MTAPKKTDPLTAPEVSTAAEIFFELFDIVLAQSPEGTSIKDAIKLSDRVFGYAHELREAKERQRAIEKELAFCRAAIEHNKGGSDV